MGSLVKKMKKEKTMEEILKEEGVITEEKSEEVKEVKSEEKVDDNFSKLLMRIEKLEGKLEMEKESRKTLEERISTINESLGDLRRLVLDREKDFSKIEKEFEVIKEAVKYFEPKRIEKNFEKLKVEIEKLQAKIEKVEVLSKEFRERLRKVEDKFSKLGDFESLAETIEKMRKIKGEIEENKKLVERLSGKVESIFSDISENLASLKRERELIRKLDDLVTDLVKNVDKLNIKFENDVVEKKDFDELKAKLEIELDQKIKEKIGKIELAQKTIEDLEMEKNKLEQALKIAEEDYRTGKISQKSFEELKSGIETKLKAINGILERIERETLASAIENCVKELRNISKRVENAASKDELDEIKDKLKVINEKLSKLPIEKIVETQIELEENKVDKEDFERFKKWVEMMLERNIVLLKKIVEVE